MTNETRTNQGQDGPVLPEQGLLEQLNVPPQAIKFIRQNAKNIQIGLIAIGLVVILALGLDSYQDSKRRKANTLLFKAMQVEDVAARNNQLQQVLEKYSSSDAASWAQLELAHDARKAGNLEDALKNYNQVAEKIDADSPLAPLVILAQGQIHESTGNFDKAFSAYEKLASMTGFTTIGMLGKARIHELREEWSLAVEIFKTLQVNETLSPEINEWLVEKIALMPSGTGQSKDTGDIADKEK